MQQAAKYFPNGEITELKTNDKKMQLSGTAPDRELDLWEAR